MGMNLFTKKADELATELKTVQETLTKLTGERDTLTTQATEAATKLTAAESQVSELTGKLTEAEGKVTDLTGKLSTAETKVTELQGKVDAVPAEIEKSAADKAIDIAANAGIAPVTGTITADSDAEPKNFAEYTATLATLEGDAADTYQNKHLEKLSNKAAQ